jgi:adenine phosphoribosyltransferase
MTKTQNQLKATVRDVANFPKEGILFKDITPVLADSRLCTDLVDTLSLEIIRSGKQVDAIAGIESRGFFFGFMLANKLGVPFIPIRKAGKLPFTTVSIEYALEYGTAKIEMNSDAITEGMNVIIHDDLLATGGTAAAAAELITRQGGNVAGFNFIINLAFLKGSENLVKYSDNITSIIEY